MDYGKGSYYFSDIDSLSSEFYYLTLQLKKYLKSLNDDNYWKLVDCWNANFDGTEFAINCQSMRDNDLYLSVDAKLNDSGGYDFTSFIVDK